MVKKRKQVSATSNLSHTSQRALEPLDQLLKNAEMGDNEKKIAYLFLALKYIHFQRSNGWVNRETSKEYYEKEDKIFNRLKNNLTADILLKEETLEESFLKQIFLSNTDLLAEAYDQRLEEGLNIFNLLSSKLKPRHEIVVEGKTFYLQEKKEDGEKIELASVLEPILHMIKREKKDIPIQKDASQGDIVSPSRRRTGMSLMEQIRAANGQSLKKTGITSPRAVFLMKRKEAAARPGFALTDADVKSRKGALRRAATDLSQTANADSAIDPELAKKLAERRGGKKLERKNAVMTAPVQPGVEESQPVSIGDGRIASLSSVDSQASTIRVASDDDMGVDEPVLTEMKEAPGMSYEDYQKIVGSRMHIQRLLAEGDDDRDPNITPEKIRALPLRRVPAIETPANQQPVTSTPPALKDDPLRKEKLRSMLSSLGGVTLDSPQIAMKFNLLAQLGSSNESSATEDNVPVPPPSTSYDPRVFRGRGRGRGAPRGRGRGASLTMGTPSRGPRTPKRGR